MQTLCHSLSGAASMKGIWILFRSNWDFQTFPLCQIFKVCLVSANLNSSVTDFRAVSWLGSGTSSARPRVRSVLVTFVSFISVCVADNADTGWHNGRVWQLLTYFDSNPENVPYWDVRPRDGCWVLLRVTLTVRRGVKINWERCNYAAFSFQHPRHKPWPMTIFHPRRFLPRTQS